MLLLVDWAFKASPADIPDWPRRRGGLKETAEHAFYDCEWVRSFWDYVREVIARIDPK